MSTYPRVDDSLADDVLTAIGATRADAVEQVVVAFRSWLPAGSTAKWAAVDRGEHPPGTDPSTALEARLAGSWASWSCWPYCTGLGGVLASMGHDVRVLVEHLRQGHQAPLVDFHSVLVVDGELLDPYLGPSAPIAPGADVTRNDAWGSWVPGVRRDHLGLRAGSTPFRYRELADHLDARDVTAFCAISTTHTGVGRRRSAHWLRGDRIVTVRDGDSGGVVRTTVGDGPFAQRREVIAHGDYADLCATIQAGTIPGAPT